MARRYPAHMGQMKSRYGKTITGMADTHPTAMYSRNTEGPFEGIEPSYTGGLFDSAVGAYGVSQAPTAPIFGFGNGGIGFGNSSGESPTPSVNPWYNGSARVFATGNVATRDTAITPGSGDDNVAASRLPLDPGMERASAERSAVLESAKRKRRPLVVFGAVAAAAAVLYGLTR